MPKCEQSPYMLNENIYIFIVQDNMVLNVCDKFAINNTQRGEQAIILDLGVPMSLARKPWINQYLVY